MSDQEKLQEVEDQLDGLDFEKLCECYDRETSHMSFTIYKYPAYQKLLAHGTRITKKLLLNLEGGQHVHLSLTLLHQITHVNPIPEKDCGRVEKMRRHWIEWGMENGYIPKKKLL